MISHIRDGGAKYECDGFKLDAQILPNTVLNSQLGCTVFIFRTIW